MTSTAAERAYAAIVTEISSQRLRPGTALREDELARLCKMSRTPVREALRRLGQEGLVEKHNSHLRVRLLGKVQIDQIYPVVAVLEGLSARLAARRLTPEILERLEALHLEMQGHAAADRALEYTDANQRFHDVVLASSGNDELIREVERMRLITMQLRRYQLGLHGRMMMSVSEHELLMYALRNHDDVNAETRMREHVESAHAVLIRAVTGAPVLAMEDAYQTM